MKNLYIDFDGVVVNTTDITYQMAKENGIKEDYTNYLEFFQKLNWNDVLNKCSQVNNSYEEIKKIIDSGRFNIYILTHVTSIHEAEAKIKLINKYFPEMSIIVVPKSVSKAKVVNAKGAILIDDFVPNLNEWTEAGGISIRFDLDMDGKGYPVIDKLSKVLELV